MTSAVIFSAPRETALPSFCERISTCFSGRQVQRAPNEAYLNPQESIKAHNKSAKCWKIAATVVLVATIAIAIAATAGAFLLASMTTAVYVSLALNLTAVYVLSLPYKKMQLKAFQNEQEAKYQIQVLAKLSQIKALRPHALSEMLEHYGFHGATLPLSDPRILPLFAHYLVRAENAHRLHDQGVNERSIPILKIAIAEKINAVLFRHRIFNPNFEANLNDFGAKVEKEDICLVLKNNQRIQYQEILDNDIPVIHTLFLRGSDVHNSTV